MHKASFILKAFPPLCLSHKSSGSCYTDSKSFNPRLKKCFCCFAYWAVQDCDDWVPDSKCFYLLTEHFWSCEFNTLQQDDTDSAADVSHWCQKNLNQLDPWFLIIIELRYKNVCHSFLIYLVCKYWNFNSWIPTQSLQLMMIWMDT